MGGTDKGTKPRSIVQSVYLKDPLLTIDTQPLTHITCNTVELGKMIGAKWKALGNVDREVWYLITLANFPMNQDPPDQYYLKQAVSDKERYDIEMSLLVSQRRSL